MDLTGVLLRTMFTCFDENEVQFQGNVEVLENGWNVIFCNYCLLCETQLLMPNTSERCDWLLYFIVISVIC